MPREIKMPKLSDTMEEGTLNVWRKAEGRGSRSNLPADNPPS